MGRLHPERYLPEQNRRPLAQESQASLCGLVMEVVKEKSEFAEKEGLHGVSVLVRVCSNVKGIPKNL